jgi:Glycosyl transferase family 2/Glycosyl transferases group 1
VRIEFVLSRRQNRFFVELASAIRQELQGLGIESGVTVGGFPPPREDGVYVLLPPHEYFRLEGGLDPIDEPLLRRTIFICAEQPGTPFFEHNASLADRAGAVFDISRAAVREFRRRGIAVRQFQLGHSTYWDRRSDGEDRDVDVLFMGCYTERRAKYLASYAPSLWRWRTHVVISDNSRPNWVASPNFVTGSDKWRLLGRSRVLLNLHQGEPTYFEWLRLVEAICNGCVIVTEHSLDHEPLQPGIHFLPGRAEALALIVQRVLEDEGVRVAIQQQAYNFLRERLSLRHAVSELVEAGTSLAQTVSLPPFIGHRHQGEPDRWVVQRPQPAPVTNDPEISLVRRELKEVALEVEDLRRELARLAMGRDGHRSLTAVLERKSAAYRGARPRVSVLTSVYNHAEQVGGALSSAVGTRYRDLELVVVDDGSTDATAARIDQWMDRHDHIPVVFVRHPVNRGLPHARNTALDFARGEFAFVLDADNTVYPSCFTRLVAALDDDNEAAFAYGMLAIVGPEGPVGLESVFPWDPDRFRASNYIDAMALLRANIVRALGAYTTDPRLYGWEDYDLWCRMAELGLRGVLVPEVVAEYRVAARSMLSITNISGTSAFVALTERYPKLMAGVEPPL